MGVYRAALVLLLFFAPLCLPAAADVVEHGGAYLTTGGVAPNAGVVNFVTVTIWCSSESHTIVPGVPDKEEVLERPDEWLFSGYPECAVAEAYNAARELEGKERVDVGLGGFMWSPRDEDVGTTAFVWTQEELFDESYIYVHQSSGAGSEGNARGCGMQSVVIVAVPLYIPPSEAVGPLWARLPLVAVDDDLAVCGSSTGWIQARYGS